MMFTHVVSMFQETVFEVTIMPSSAPRIEIILVGTVQKTEEEPGGTLTVVIQTSMDPTYSRAPSTGGSPCTGRV